MGSLIGKILGFTGLDQLQLIIGLAIAAAFGVVSFGLYHYYNAYLDEIKIVGQKDGQIKEIADQLVEANTNLKVCGDDITKLSKDSSDRAAKADEAVAAAQLDSAKQKKYALQLLSRPTTITQPCPQVDDVLNKYLMDPQTDKSK